MVEAIKRIRDINDSSQVLIIDDDSDTREMLSRTIASVGCTVTQASGGAMALNRMREQKPSVVLLDIMMPEMDGFEFLEHLRQEPAWMDIKVIIVSAKDLTTEDLEWLNSRSTQIFQKGIYNRHELIETVSAALDPHHSEIDS